MRLDFRKYIVAVLLLGASIVQLSAQENASYANKTLRARSWGNYPIVLSNEVRGGIHHITGLSGSDFSEVNDSIPAERRQTGMLCVVGGISWTASDIVLMYNGTDWNRINFTRVWESSATYFNGQTVYENGNLYVARVANPTSQPSLDTTEWHDLASKLDQILVSDGDTDDGLTYNTTNHEYDVNVDNSTIEISGDNLQVIDLGITTGKLDNNAVTAGKLAVTGTGTSGQILSSSADGSFFWEDASNLNVNPNNIDLSSASLLVGNGSGKAQARAISGDVAITNQGVTTVAGLVTNANAISAETTARLAADNTLQSNIDAEETARITADATLTTGLASEVTNRTNADAAIQSELDATQLGAGLETEGTYTANGTANYISSSTSLKDADDDLDVAIKANADAILGGTSDLQDEVDAIEAGAGLDADGDYVVNGSANYISGAVSLNAADVLLDTQVKSNADDISTNATAITAEATTRGAADVALQNNIDAINQLNSGDIYVGNSSNAATARTMSGDASISNTGALSLNENVVGANELDVADDGTDGQLLSSDGAGGFAWQTFSLNTTNVMFIDATETLTFAQQGVVMCDGNFTITLPNASTEGQTYTVKNIGAGTVTIDGNGSQTIDGDANYPLDEQFASISLVSYNSAWYVVDRQSKNTVHIGNPGVNGSWRITLGVGNTLSFEQYNGTNWIYKMEIED